MLLNKPLHIKTPISRLLQHPLLCNNTSNIFRWSYIKCWIPTWHILRRATTLDHFTSRPFLNLDLITTLQFDIQRRERTGHEEFNSHLLGNNGQCESTNLVRCISISTDTIRAHHTGIGSLTLDIRRRHRITYQSAIHALRLNFIRRQTRALIVRPRFQRGNTPQFPPQLQLSCHAQRRSPAGRGQGASVADGDQSHSIRMGVVPR
mmetsp:Transcript_20542/g.36513  ORF Transcript_20542/g.36513 Transcript_20542/m.36513 type:complete len:206 (-) Transcript_20542:607-1224(-)